MKEKRPKLIFLDNPDIHKNKQIPIEYLTHPSMNHNERDYVIIKEEIPCVNCIVLGICKSKTKINCDILFDYFKSALEQGANTLLLYKKLLKILTNSYEINGTLIM